MLIYIESCYRIRLNTSVKYKGCNYLFCHGLFIFNKMFDFFKKKRKHTEFLFSNCEAFKVLDLRSCPSCCCSFTRQCSMYSSHLKTRRVLSQRRWVRLRGQAKDVRNGFDYLKKLSDEIEIIPHTLQKKCDYSSHWLYNRVALGSPFWMIWPKSFFDKSLSKWFAWNQWSAQLVESVLKWKTSA